ncbi:hypothetical protein L7F22_029975 [Adiantum nelumboides]|nr:hypothetical protein [Adiantum nelumboides]
MLLQQGTNSHYMKPIYCASKVKLEVERNYTDVELIMVSVVYACRRFRHYLLPKPFTFLTSYTLLPQLVTSPTLSKRLMKFIVELQEFQFSFLVEESTKSTLADLLTYKEAPLLVKEDTLKKQHMEAPDIDNAFLLFFDGSYKKSHNEASGGIVIYDPQGNLVTKRGLKLTAQSNNEAEYATLENGLQLCLELGIQRVKVKGDALLVVKQVLGVWQSKNPRLKNMCFHVKNLLKHFEAWSLRHIDRSHNEEAYAAAQAMIGQLYVIRVDSPLYLRRESLEKEEWLFTNRFASSRVGEIKEVCLSSSYQKEGYVWPSIQRDVHHWCKSCKECQSMASRVLRSEIKGTILAYDVFEKWGIDAIGPNGTKMTRATTDDDLVNSGSGGHRSRSMYLSQIDI